MVTVRPARPDDAAAWSRVAREATPLHVQDARSTAHEFRTEREGAVRLVAEADGAVVGAARLFPPPDVDHVTLTVMTLPGHRRQGTGGALLAALEPAIERSGRAEVHTIVEDDDDSRAAARHWGFELTRTFRMSSLDPRTVPDPGPDARVTPLAELEPRAVWRLFNAVVADDPSGVSLPVPFPAFLDEWEDPRHRPDLGRGVVLDDELAAFTMVGAAGDRAWSNMTGTRPDHRGAGLALLAKRHALHATGRAGVVQCFAGNDGHNAAMVAVNTRLGYRPAAAQRLGVRRR
jgi:GNAT superfamily N-acetyltransferase